MLPLENNEDSDEMPRNAAFSPGLYCLIRQKVIFRERNTILFGIYNLYFIHTMDQTKCIVLNHKEESG